VGDDRLCLDGHGRDAGVRKLGDLLGRKPLFIAALWVFVAGCVLGGLAPDMTWLIVA
jgi:MFS family permease